jgi:hypothetical protein
MKSDDKNRTDYELLLARIDSLEKRISHLESNSTVRRQIPEMETEQDDTESVISIAPNNLFETNLGEYGLAWLGNIVLFLAIAFLCQYFINTDNPIISLMIGAVSIFSVFVLSNISRKNYTYLSYIFNLFGFILLFYLILRLHFYNVKPLIGSLTVSTLLLLIVVGFLIYRSVKRNSQPMMSLAYTFGMITAFSCNQMHAFFLISIIITGIALYFFWNYSWWKSLIYFLCISYFIYLVWLLKNHVALFRSPEDLAYYFVFFYISVTTAIYSLLVFKKPDSKFPEMFTVTTILMAGISYSALLLILVFINSSINYVPLFSAIALYCIAYSIILKIYSVYKYSPALYALFGFVGASIAIYGVYQFPDSFLLLFIQSFVVLILALWYRSQVITLINTFLLVFLTLGYYKISGTLHSVNFAIPVVAFMSARIINWQKERLNIKTDFIRNIYLLTLFISMLYATSKAIPTHYVTISWLIISGVYFGLSILLKNIKYRWMALANLLISALHLFLVDLAKTDIIFRILAFLVFAVISITISTYYVRRLKKKDEVN